MFLADYHMHTSWSHDSATPMKDFADEAIKRNLSEICFTDHCEVIKELGWIDYSEYTKEFYDIQKKYRDKIDIKLGVELGIKADKIDVFDDLVKSYDFDYVLASTHRVDYVGVVWPEYWEGISKLDGYRKYYEYMYESVKLFDNYNCWGHLDYIIRHGEFKAEDKGFKYSELGDILDEIMKIIIHKGKGIEINTSAKNKGFNHFHPQDDILKRYKELGGEIISVGSDTHSLKHLGFYIKDAYDLLENLGFKYVNTFTKRKENFLKLSDLK